MNFDKMKTLWKRVMGSTTIVFGDIVAGNLTVAEFTADEFAPMLGKNVFSSTIGDSNLRWGRGRPLSPAIKALAVKGKAVMSEQQFLSLARDYPNKGIAFEAVMVQHYGGKPTAANTPHCDFTIEKRKYECKFGRSATVINGEYLFNLFKDEGLTLDEVTQESKS